MPKKEDKETNKEEKSITISLNTNIIKLIGVAVIFLIIGYLSASYLGSATNLEKQPDYPSQDVAVSKAVDFVNTYLTQTPVQLNNVSEKYGMYRISVETSGQFGDIYLTKDGETLFTQAINMEEAEQQIAQQQAQSQSQTTTYPNQTSNNSNM